jgi:hypothetical protein
VLQGIIGIWMEVHKPSQAAQSGKRYCNYDNIPAENDDKSNAVLRKESKTAVITEKWLYRRM